MRKIKIREITRAELKKYCDSPKRICRNCVFKKVPCTIGLNNCFIYNKDLYNEKFLDQEIELDED